MNLQGMMEVKKNKSGKDILRNTQEGSMLIKGMSHTQLKAGEWELGITPERQKGS